MKINISYALCTDGDYKLNNAENFGCTGRNVEVNDFEYYNYVGSVEFVNEEKWRCKADAKNFLYKFLCDGLHVSYTHYWLLRDFYNLIESLVEVIDNYETGMSVSRKHISGNYMGTGIEVAISE